MTPQELADRLDGTEYGDDVNPEKISDAKEFGLVVMYGLSDDIVAIAGACGSDDCGAWHEDGGSVDVYMTRAGFAQSECLDGHDCPYFVKLLKQASKFTARKTNEGWRIATNVPHAKFTIYEDGEVFGVGIVFRRDDLAEPF